MAALCPDWILSIGSDVHVAVDRGWFTTYTPYKTHLVSVFGRPPIEVCGIGTVTIHVLNSKFNKGKQSQHTITLNNVLHAPKNICNILGQPFFDETDADLGFKDQVIRGRDGSIIALFELHPKQASPSAGMRALSGLPRLKLCDRPNITLAESKLEPDVTYVTTVSWPEAERRKYIENFNATATATATATSAGVSATTSSVPPYTTEEKDWLKHKSGHKDEFHFLRAHGLRIDRDDDREEGRQILRALMVNSGPDEGDDDEEEDEDEEWDPTGHQADYAFKHEELEFIEKQWGTSEIFLMSHGLKFYDDEDLEEGRAIVQALMAEVE